MQPLVVDSPRKRSLRIWVNPCTMLKWPRIARVIWLPRVIIICRNWSVRVLRRLWQGKSLVTWLSRPGEIRLLDKSKWKSLRGMESFHSYNHRTNSINQTSAPEVKAKVNLDWWLLKSWESYRKWQLIPMWVLELTSSPSKKWTTFLLVANTIKSCQQHQDLVSIKQKMVLL